MFSSLHLGIAQLAATTNQRPEAQVAAWISVAQSIVFAQTVLLAWTNKCGAVMYYLERGLPIVSPPLTIAVLILTALSSTHHSCTNGPSPGARL
jgi:hypothetical protein